MPGGAAVGAAVQFRMLATSGSDTDSAVGGLAAFSLLGVGGLLALPVFALPVILLGSPTNRGLVNAAVLGAVGFVVFAAFGAVVLTYDAPLRWAGRAAQRVRNWVLRKKPPLEGLDETLLAQRNEIRKARPSWPRSPTGSPRTGCRCSPDLSLTACSGSGIEAAGPPARPQCQLDTDLPAEAGRFESSLVGARCGRYPGADGASDVSDRTPTGLTSDSRWP